MKTDYFEMQAAVGSTKHLGGIRSSRVLLEDCHVAEAREVLDVGCGIGIQPVHIARTTRAHVVGLDLSARMLAWADLRARDAGVRDRIELVQGDACVLPFETDRFDVVIAESVLSFVPDRAAAIRELVRVARPGGRVGINEGFPRVTHPSGRIEAVTRFMPEPLATLDEWKTLWAASGLEDRRIRIFRPDEAQETRDRLRWLGLAWPARVVGRAIWLYIREPRMRSLFHAMVRSVVERERTGPDRREAVWVAVDYGIFTGRKPSGPVDR